MPLIKSIASTVKNGKIVEEGKDIPMHPLEEASMRVYWAMNDIHLPEKPTLEQEHEWLLEFGVDYIKQKRKEWQKEYDAMLPILQAAQEKSAIADKAWVDHCELCIANGLEPDIYPGDARKELKFLKKDK